MQNVVTLVGVPMYIVWLGVFSFPFVLFINKLFIAPLGELITTTFIIVVNVIFFYFAIFIIAFCTSDYLFLDL